MIMTVGNDCDSGVFNYMTKFSFLHYLEFDFLSLATKKLWTKNPPPFFLAFILIIYGEIEKPRQILLCTVA